MTSYDYFISSRWRNKENVMTLTHALREQGHSVYCFFENHPDDNLQPEAYMAQFETLAIDDQKVKHIFTTDLNGLKSSTHLILLLPAGNSAHIEAGIAFGLGKKCILIGHADKTDSLYHIFSQHYLSIDEFMRSLQS